LYHLGLIRFNAVFDNRQKGEWYNHIMDLHERGGGPGVIFGKDYPSLHARTIGEHSGVPFTKQRQLDMYRKLEGRRGDQIVYAMVLAQTGGLVYIFMAREDGIIFPSLLELASVA
jgi:hypothetical protein